MQILEVPSLDNKEHTIETFLISTKGNDANWKIDKETGHEKVKSFIGKDFSIIPELLFRPLEQGGGGHVFGPRDYVLKKYADNSHGKIVELRGPFYDGKLVGQDRFTVNTGKDDYYYNAIVKLNDSRAASALLEHGNNTWVPFAVSPHIFINEEGGGNDEVGWKDWSGAALALVIKGAYGNEAVISKLCNGPHKACKMELMQRKASIGEQFIQTDFYTDNQTANLITSLVSRSASTNSLTMVDTTTKLSTEPEQPEKPDNGGGQGQEQQQQQMKIIKDTEVIKPNTEQINISADELNQLRETQKQFKEMQNERRDELLKEIFANADNEEQRNELIKEYSKLDLTAVKGLKAFHDKISPLVANATKKAIEMELQQKKEEEAKKNKVNSNGRSASISLRPEPKVEKEEESRAASSSKVDEVALLKKFMTNNGGNFY